MPQLVSDRLTLRPAVPADAGAAVRLLTACDLPVDDVAGLLRDHAADFVVADDPVAAGELAAIAGLEVHGQHALLRSVAVRPEWRKLGVGDQLVRYLVCEAESRGIRALYLLTMTAERYFPRFGFERIDRGDVPEAIEDTREFRSTCPASAVAMCRTIRP